MSFTARGAVGTPRTVQIRVGSVEGGALRAGAPSPSRSLTVDEVEAEVRWFTAGKRGPRTVPCNELVLSGCAGSAHGLGRVARLARELGIERVVLHGAGPPDLVAAVDAVAVRCSSLAELPRSAPHRAWTAHVPLTTEAVARLDTLTDRLIGLDPTRVVLSWPFPGDVTVPPVHEAIAAARIAQRRLIDAGVQAAIRGLPPCLDGPERSPTGPGRTRNRFYVDADHRGAAALLFVPDVVQFLKPDACRSCAWTTRCDGVARAWLESGVLGRLEPVVSPAT